MPILSGRCILSCKSLSSLYGFHLFLCIRVAFCVLASFLCSGRFLICHQLVLALLSSRRRRTLFAHLLRAYGKVRRKAGRPLLLLSLSWGSICFVCDSSWSSSQREVAIVLVCRDCSRNIPSRVANHGVRERLCLVVADADVSGANSSRRATPITASCS